MYRFLYGIVFGIIVLTIISEIVMFMTEPSFLGFVSILIRGVLISAIFIALAEIYSYVKASYHLVEAAHAEQREGKKSYPEVGKIRSQSKQQEEWQTKL